MVYHSDVEFLEDANPALLDRNAAEFKRLNRLINSTESALRRASGVRWQSEASALYLQRLGEAKHLTDALATAFGQAGHALSAYADAVYTAKQYYDSGEQTEGKLGKLIASVTSSPMTPVLNPIDSGTDPLHQWEDLRSSQGILDRLRDVLADVDSIRDEAERYYRETVNHYDDALRMESMARGKCVAELGAAYKSLPDFRGAAADPGQLLRSLGPLMAEARESSNNPNVQLPGSGPKVDAIPTQAADVPVTEALDRIRNRAAGLPDGVGNNYWLPSNSDEDRRNYIAANKQLIMAAARDSGLPPEMVAGIAWQEVEGDPGVVDDLAFEGRKALGTKDPDETSMGPLSIQIRRAAEVLGYDPNHLTEDQRNAVVGAVRDPKQNIFIASEYLAQMKAESGFADVPPEKMTRAQMQELAARYNGGPYYQSPAAQAYGRAFDQRVDAAGQALQ